MTVHEAIDLISSGILSFSFDSAILLQSSSLCVLTCSRPQRDARTTSTDISIKA